MRKVNTREIGRKKISKQGTPKVSVIEHTSQSIRLRSRQSNVGTMVEGVLDRQHRSLSPRKREKAFYVFRHRASTIEWPNRTTLVASNKEQIPRELRVRQGETLTANVEPSTMMRFT